MVAKAGVKTQAKGAIEEAIVDHNVTSQEDTNAGSSPQGWGDKLKRVASNIIHALIPPGGTSVGVTGAVLDFTGEAGVFLDKSGDAHIGLAVGFGGNTGANVDAGFYVQNLPWASGAGAMEGWTVNLGLSVGEGGQVVSKSTSQQIRKQATQSLGLRLLAHYPPRPISRFHL